MKAKIDKKYQEELKKDLQVVKDKIPKKRGFFPIRSPVKDFLAENYLIPSNEASIGGKGESDQIIDFLFMKGRINAASSECLARRYQEGKPDYWHIMKKYLKRFFFIHSWQRDFTGDHQYDFDSWDDPRPNNYPTHQEKLKAWDKACKVGKDKLNKREQYALQTLFDETKEEESETIYDNLSMVGHQFGWTLPDFNFRYVALFDPDLKEFWKGCGLEVNENLKFLLSKNVQSYHFLKVYGEKYKIPKYSVFSGSHHSDYVKLKAQLINEAKVRKQFFERLEDTYLNTQIATLIPMLSRIVRPLFLVAHFLEKEDPDIYDYHQELSKIFLSAMNSKNEHLKNWAVGEVTVRRVKDFLFDAVWQDFLFDDKRYLQQPKTERERKGRPPDITNHLLVYLIKNELEKHEAKLSENVNLTTAKLINSLKRDNGFNIAERNPVHLYIKGAEAVRRIYKQAQKKFEKI